MSRLSDHELNQLLEDVMAIDKTMRFVRESMFSKVSGPLAPRISRLLAEQRTLREQAAERESMAHLEGSL